MTPAIRTRGQPCIALIAALVLCACGRSSAPDTAGGPPQPPPQAGECGDHSPYRNAYFGDLHIHTSYSFDSYLFGNQVNDPAVAYDFAQGARIRLNDNAAGERHVQLRQPLDFAAVTDHSEYLGEVRMCSDPEQDPLAYYDPMCVQFRTSDPTSSVGFLAWGLRLTNPRYGRQAFCIYGDCTAAAASAWEDSARVTESRNSPCAFTTFHAYEYSPSSDGTRMHRNIIFRTAAVPPLPVSYFEAPEPITLFKALNEACREEDGCEYLSIPHNSNLSHGRLLWADPERFSDPQYVADLREIARLNPVLEMIQVKGNSECKQWLGTSTDEECEFEQLRSKPICCNAAEGITENCVDKPATPAAPYVEQPVCHEVCPGDRAKEGGGGNGDNAHGCMASHDFVRGAFIKGMAAQRQLGFNPARYALIAATDNHNAATGDVDEAGSPDAPYGWAGAHGGQDDDPEERLDVLSNTGSISNPGGLAGVWAEENTREALFAALQRGEVFATSGTRMRLRFFAGDYPPGMCAQSGEAMKRTAYARGVPMGGNLSSTTATPRFVIQTAADQHPLQRTQVVKLWVDAEGRGHEKVFDVARYAEPATVSERCEVGFKAPPQGRMAVCEEWEDPEFDATQHASYYARVFEDSSCRWTGHLCAALVARDGLDCAATPEHACCASGDDGVKKVIQERAWSSPIWYVPEGGS
jgi:hypothetical protein